MCMSELYLEMYTPVVSSRNQIISGFSNRLCDGSPEGNWKYPNKNRCSSIFCNQNGTFKIGLVPGNCITRLYCWCKDGFVWWFPSMGVPKIDVTIENPMDDLGVPLFQETSLHLFEWSNIEGPSPWWQSWWTLEDAANHSKSSPTAVLVV